jgi:hypothetical protein
MDWNRIAVAVTVAGFPVFLFIAIYQVLSGNGARRRRMTMVALFGAVILVPAVYLRLPSSWRVPESTTESHPLHRDSDVNTSSSAVAQSARSLDKSGGRLDGGVVPNSNDIDRRITPGSMEPSLVIAASPRRKLSNNGSAGSGHMQDGERSDEDQVRSAVKELARTVSELDLALRGREQPESSPPVQVVDIILPPEPQPVALTPVPDVETYQPINLDVAFPVSKPRRKPWPPWCLAKACD